MPPLTLTPHRPATALAVLRPGVASDVGPRAVSVAGSPQVGGGGGDGGGSSDTSSEDISDESDDAISWKPFLNDLPVPSHVNGMPLVWVEENNRWFTFSGQAVVAVLSKCPIRHQPGDRASWEAIDDPFAVQLHEVLLSPSSGHGSSFPVVYARVVLVSETMLDKPPTDLQQRPRITVRAPVDESVVCQCCTLYRYPAREF